MKVYEDCIGAYIKIRNSLLEEAGFTAGKTYELQPERFGVITLKLVINNV